jgi:aminomethyltransferase
VTDGTPPIVWATRQQGDKVTRHSPLESWHLAHGASMTEFAGWLMPIRYSSDIAEHHAVRNAAGLFDLTHMGEIAVTGPGAPDALDFALVGRMSRVEVGRAKYTMIGRADGGVIDDLVVYREAPERFLVVANASNAPRVVIELTDRCAAFDCEVRDESADTALIAVQGPQSPGVLSAMLESDEAEKALHLKYYASIPTRVCDTAVVVARTGYTGEDGFEFFCPVGIAEAVWDLALGCGADAGIVPCGLAARDTLRLEAGMPLYGHELSESTTAFEAGLGRVVNFGTPDDPRGEFVGDTALAAAASRVQEWEANPASAPEEARLLVGLSGEGRRSPRAGYRVLEGEGVVGEVTSGAPSPTLGRLIAMAYVHPRFRAIGTTVSVDVRGRREDMTVCALPFYQRSR